MIRIFKSFWKSCSICGPFWDECLLVDFASTIFNQSLINCYYDYYYLILLNLLIWIFVQAATRTQALSSGTGTEYENDNSFQEFRRLCLQLADEPSYNAKTKIVASFFNKGASGGNWL